MEPALQSLIVAFVLGVGMLVGIDHMAIRGFLPGQKKAIKKGAPRRKK
jgi:hypothetical protein